MILDIKPIKQKPLHCGPACMQRIFEFYNIDGQTQERIGKEMNVRFNRGCYPFQVIRYFRKYGIESHKVTVFRDKWGETYKYLKKNRPIMISNGSHFMLLVGCEQDFGGHTTFFIMDPQKCEVVKKNTEYMKGKIKDYIIIDVISYENAREEVEYEI